MPDASFAALLILILIVTLFAIRASEKPAPLTRPETEADVEKATSEIQHIQARIAALRETAINVTVESNEPLIRTIPSSDGERFYTVDFAGQTCTCPDWAEVRAKYSAGHLRRFCKHIAAAMISEGSADDFLTAVFSNIHFGISEINHFGFLSTEKQPKIFVFREGNREWVDVIALGIDGYKLFGYNMLQRRWSYHEPPIDTDRVEAEIAEWIVEIEAAATGDELVPF
jgi:hypothetical protein